jgi:hypothetical protein
MLPSLAVSQTACLGIVPKPKTFGHELFGLFFELLPNEQLKYFFVSMFIDILTFVTGGLQ